MNLDGMLEKCVREQWDVGDLDWSGRPRELSRDDEMAIVQYFTDMAGIERLAGALFREQMQRAKDPRVREIFRLCVKDEIRHSHAAQMLADYYDVHKYKPYQVNPHFAKFYPNFIHAVKYLSADIANAYITAGELILDIALLRSLNDHVNDAMSERAMKLINRDESRHIWMDYYMTEYYCSDAYQRELAAQPGLPPAETARAWWAFAKVMFHARPFFRDVFFRPMEVVDPEGKRITEAFKRIQLLADRPGVAKRPFIRFMNTLRDMYRNPVFGTVFGGALERVIGVDGRMLVKLYDDTERRRAHAMTFEGMAEEALGAKQAS